MKDTIAIILGGGRGTRLFPLTLERAKPAVGLAGKYRLIDVPVSNCINSGIKRIYVITQFMSTSLHRHIMQTYNFDVFSDGFVEILAAEQTPESQSWFQGTADAVRATIRHTTYFKSDATLILSGDHLYRMDYSKLLKYHHEQNSDITLAVYPVTKEDAPRMGLLKSNKDGKVTEFAEKPKDPDIIKNYRAPTDLLEKSNIPADDERYLASMGIYVFNPKVLVESLNQGDQIDFGKEIIPSAINNYNVFAYPFSGYWEDIGTIDTFFDANIQLAQPEPDFRLYEPGLPIYTRTRSLPPSRIIKSDIIDSIIVEGSDVHGAKIMDSIVGLRSIIKSGTKLNEVIMMGADYYEGEEFLQSIEDLPEDIPPLGIGKNCDLDRVIIDKNARIGNNVKISRKKKSNVVEHQNYWIRDGITIIRRGAILHDNTEI